MKPKPATYKYGQSGHPSSSELTYMYEQSSPSVPYDKAQHGLNNLPVSPSGSEYNKVKINRLAVTPKLLLLNREMMANSSRSLAQAGMKMCLNPSIKDNLYPSLAPSQYEQVSRPIWNPGTMHQGKGDAFVADYQSIFKPPTPAGYSFLYEYNTYQSEQTLPGRFSAVEQQPPPLIHYTGTGQIDGKAPFTKPLMEPDFSWNSNGSAEYHDYLSPPG